MEASHCTRIALIGPPGTGKSTVSQALQVHLGSVDFLTGCVGEYARDYLVKFGSIEHIAIQQGLGYKQKRREDVQAVSYDLLISDSPVYFSYLYALMSADPHSRPQMKIVRDLYKWMVLDELHRYDCVIYLPLQFDVVNDGVRDVNATATIEPVITGFLDAHKHLFKNYVEIRSDQTHPKKILHDRVNLIEHYLRTVMDIPALD